MLDQETIKLYESVSGVAWEHPQVKSTENTYICDPLEVILTPRENPCYSWRSHQEWIDWCAYVAQSLPSFLYDEVHTEICVKAHLLGEGWQPRRTYVTTHYDLVILAINALWNDYKTEYPERFFD